MGNGYYSSMLLFSRCFVGYGLMYRLRFVSCNHGVVVSFHSS